MIYAQKRRQINRTKKIKNFFSLSAHGKKPDLVLIGTIFFILVFGLMMLSSASSVESFRKFGSTYYLFRRQLLYGLLPGIILFFFFLNFNYKKLQNHLVLYLGLIIFLLVIVFVPGIGASYGRATSWINVAGFSLQPTEIVKLLLVLFLAGWFSQRSHEMNQDFWNGLLPFAIILGVISGLVVLQPDLGTLTVVVALSFMIYVVAGGRWRHIIGLFVLGLGGASALIAAAPYRAARLLTFINPNLDPQGIGYHINQALLAVGSGGWFGMGLGQSRQKFAYLPEVMGDSIFAVIVEEIGFIFAAILIVAFIVLLLRGLKIAKETNDDFARLVVVGIVSWFTLQAFFNIGAMLGILPLTGIPLPFISYGGTALMSSLAAAGILANISRDAS
ncbi:MAG: putative lipid II flippase FtsW [Candidatus Buchananbacteria bacterium]|nr:putative lipid II flippase FtsW [Candidatus Buchananbacteria bacterium]